jgi:hypothetical protein
VPIQYKDQLNTAFTTIADHRAECVYNKSAAHQVALEDSYVFHVYEDTPIEVLNHMYHVNQQVGKNMISLPPCDWREKECASNHLMRDCPIYKALSGREQLDHMMVSQRCLNCFKKGHRASQCTLHLRCLTCKLNHNSALHIPWQEKRSVVALMIKNVSPISLLTSPVLVATDNSALKKETNLIHDNGASVSLMSKEIADAIDRVAWRDETVGIKHDQSLSSPAGIQSPNKHP